MIFLPNINVANYQLSEILLHIQNKIYSVKNSSLPNDTPYKKYILKGNYRISKQTYIPLNPCHLSNSVFALLLEGKFQ